jgi:Domain of unknown function (DUF4157)
MADQTVATQAKAATSAPQSSQAAMRTCSCGRHLTPGGGECEACRRARQATLQRSALSTASRVGDVPSIVTDVLSAPGRPLDPRTRGAMEMQFGYDFSHVRVHADARAAESARAVDALAYTVGRDVVFGRDGFRPDTGTGRRLLAHELTHVVQQGAARTGAGPPATSHELEAERAADAVAGGGTVRPAQRALHGLQRAGDPFIKKVTVHLKPKQSADLAWEGSPPVSAPGKDHFTVSTGKGYMDPDVDPPRTCTRDCCTDPNKQCVPPWDKPGKIGACCTYTGTNFWTGKPEDDHGGWKFWTPIQPHYEDRKIALHQHTEVTGDPIGHGCVRMELENAERIAKHSRGRRTAVEIEGLAAPVLCRPERRCGTTGSLQGGPVETRLAQAEVEAIPGLEGEMS